MNATLTLDKDFVLSEIDPRVYGGFAEHLGRHIYTGIYEPGHPTADNEGFREDVISLVKELSMPIIRYPGGNFVSGYNWEDGVGPRAERPRRLELAWGITETNEFGTNEFMSWCKKVGSEAMMAVNLGTRGPDDARRLVEYCNHPGGTQLSDLRKSHGVADPYGIKVWCLGNEMDGPWQMGSRTAYEYGRVANETAKLMKWVDGRIETILCGSSGRGMASFGKWEWESLQESYENVDYLSLHTYYNNRANDTPAFLAETENMADFIAEAVALCDAVKASKKSKKTVNLSFDEWNVWYHSGDWGQLGARWDDVRPQLEDIYNMEDVLVVGGMLLAMLKHADRLKIGCIAQIVNVIAPIMTRPGGGAWRQTIFYPLQHCSQYGRGTALRTAISSPTYDSKSRDKAPYLATSAVVSESGDELTIFAINRSLTEPLELTTTLHGFGKAEVMEWITMHHADLKAVNTEQSPDNVVPQAATGATVSGETLKATLPAASWNVIRLRI
ncbi:MAG: alpha-N-arabinofuranosidase [Armatimonadetes bacterium]|nr:alpha-N-arabinofuranosidase [Armatimonadota bacterium]